MKVEFKIEWIPYEKMETILPLVFSLNDGRLGFDVLKKRLDSMLKMESYRCIGVYDKDDLIGICGVWMLHKFYAGKHLEADNVYVKPEYRSKGVGELMMQWLFDFAKKENCESVEANCYIKNVRGEKFWKSQGFEALGYHMIKKFDTI